MPVLPAPRERRKAVVAEVFVNLRVTPAERQKMEEAARLEGRTLSGWARFHLRAAAGIAPGK